MSTLQEKIAVMQAFEQGKTIEFRSWSLDSAWQGNPNPLWNWDRYIYRVKKEKKTFFMYAKPSSTRSGLGGVSPHMFSSKEELVRHFKDTGISEKDGWSIVSVELEV